MYHLAYPVEGGLVFHGAGLARGPHGVVLMGQSGAGKSYLTTWFLRQGWDYLSDELICVGDADLHLQGFARPIGLKMWDSATLENLVQMVPGDSEILQTPYGLFIQARALLKSAEASPPPGTDPYLNAMLFPRYRPDSPLRIERLSKGQVSLRLMSGLLNARNLQRHGFDAVVRIARTVPAYSLTYSGFDQVAQASETLFGSLYPADVATRQSGS